MRQLSSILKGCVLHMPLAEETYNPATRRLTDKSAYGNHGTAAIAANFTADRMAHATRAMLLNGADDHVDCGNDTSLDITESITISAWVKLSGLSRAQSILSKGAYSLKIGLDDRPFFTIVSGDVASWTNTGNLKSAGWVYTLAAHHGKLYAGTRAGGNVFVYNEVADTWAEAGELSGADIVFCLTTYNDKLYAGTNPGGNVFVYDETANTWAETGDLSGASHANAFATLGGKLYMGTYPSGEVFVYDEVADTWANTGNLVGATFVGSLAVHDGKLYAGSHPSGDVFVYNEVADTWANTGNVAGSTAIDSLTTFGGKLYAGARTGGDVFVYDDVADTWANTGNLLNAQRVSSLIAHNGKLYAGTYPHGDAFVYDEVADTWANVGNLISITEIYAMTTFNGKLYAGCYPNGDVFVGGNGMAVYANTALDDSSHVHLSASYDKTKLRVYINNVAVADSDFTSSMVVNTLDLLIGDSYGSTQSSHGSGSEEAFDGKIADVWVHNRVLTAAERTFLYESYNPSVII